ncbi:MAG: DUF6952 family protein [Bacteroidia bacterium]
MKIQVIKKLVEQYSLTEIIRSEELILDGKVSEIQVEGEDEGEQLTHVFAARFILEKMENGIEFKEALREFTQKVRTSIS